MKIKKPTGETVPVTTTVGVGAEPAETTETTDENDATNAPLKIKTKVRSGGGSGGSDFNANNGSF